MNIRARELPTPMNVQELRKRNKWFAFCIINNQKCLIIGKEQIISNLPQKFQITIEEKIKNSLVKQSMQMQLGRVPQQYRTEVRTHYATQLNTPYMGMYKAYEIL